MKFRVSLLILIFGVLVLLTGCVSNRSSLLEKRVYRSGWSFSPIKRLRTNPVLKIQNRTDKDISTVHSSFIPKNDQRVLLQPIIKQSRENVSQVALPSESSKPVVSPFTGRRFEPLRNEAIEEKTEESVQIFQEAIDEPKAPIITAGIIALIIALINLLFFMWVPFLGVLSALLSIVFAIKALKLDNKNSKLYGAASLIISAFTIFVSIIMTFVLMNGLQLFGNI